MQRERAGGREVEVGGGGARGTAAPPEVVSLPALWRWQAVRLQLATPGQWSLRLGTEGIRSAGATVGVTEEGEGDRGWGGVNDHGGGSMGPGASVDR